ncbi:hypothetical protein SVAN01_09151 [Stagonosporopsis vannaccii]|nr:hypothetical protein SVAN01_09151 [Stagonosporopsis vannaccii]
MTSDIVVGIDFGTTYSGASWARCAGHQTIRVVNDWPNPASSFATSDKVASQLSYKDGKLWHWGYSVHLTEKALVWFKLLLEPANKYAQDSFKVGETLQQLAVLDKTPEDVTADYIRIVWQHIKEDIQKVLGNDWETVYSVRAVLTVPAIWSDNAKARTLRIACMAGLPENVSLLSEPEAAALAILRERKEEGHILQIGDCFVVCDAGGGTVDLISYRIRSLSPFELEECTAATGALCGSIFIDQAFEKYIRTIVGESHSTLKIIFDNVIDRILRLVEQQVDNVGGKGDQVKAIVLVGGLGMNRYLYQRLSEAYKPTCTQVFQSIQGWASICRGATMWGLEHPDQNSLASSSIADPGMILIMGASGSGKSHFINRLAGSNVVAENPDLRPRAQECSPVPVVTGWNKGMTLFLEMRGFDSIDSTDYEALNELASYLSSPSARRIRIKGVIYIHRITDNRYSRAAVRNLELCKRVCGRDAYKNVILVTSGWHQVDASTAEGREKQLEDDFWASMISQGSNVGRYYGDQASAVGLLNTMMSQDEVVLQLQKELLDDGKELDATAAGSYIKPKLEGLQQPQQGIYHSLQKPQRDSQATMRAIPRHKDPECMIPGLSLKDTIAPGAAVNVAQEKLKRELEEELAELQGRKQREQEEIASMEYLRKHQQEELALLERQRQQQQQDLDAKERLKQSKQEEVATLEGIKLRMQDTLASMAMTKQQYREELALMERRKQQYREELDALEAQTRFAWR